MKRRRPFLLILLLAAAGRGGDVAVTLKQRSSYEVEGTFQVPAPRSVAWDVLTDYEHIGDFIPAVKQSWVAERKTGEALVGQNAEGSLLFFSRRVSLRLRVLETPPGGIAFEDLSGWDFATYAGEWRLEESPGGTSVVYRLKAEPRFHVPGFLLRGVLKRGAQELLIGVRDEIIRRNGGKQWARGRLEPGSQPGN